MLAHLSLEHPLLTAMVNLMQMLMLSIQVRTDKAMVRMPFRLNRHNGAIVISMAMETTNPRANLIDDFPDNPTQFRDTDLDGWGDNQTYGATQVDDFPLIPSQYRDSDGDGYGDNLAGFEGDVCVNSDAEEVRVAGFHVSIALDAEMSTKMGTLTQPRNGSLTHKALLMPSRRSFTMARHRQ